MIVTMSGEVHVQIHGLLSAHAVCSCGWCGGRRHLKASAEYDAWEHALRTPCSVSFPLINPCAATTVVG